MATVAEFRQYAQECMTAAHEAPSDEIRKQYLDLAQLWLTAALRMEMRPGQPFSDQLDGHTAPPSAGRE